MDKRQIDLEEVANLCEVMPEPRDRSKWHVSNLIESAYLISKGDVRYHEYEGQPKGIMSLGRIWEAAADTYLFHYAEELGGYYLANVVGEQDGVVASLDGVLFTPELGTVVVETKLRFTLSSDIPMKHQQQTRAYCKLANTRKVLYVVLHVSSAPPTAVATMEIIEHSQLQIDENWQMIVNTKECLEAQGLGPKKE